MSGQPGSAGARANGADPGAITIREATEADHARLAGLVREWWDERPPRLDRLWFRYFPGTTLVAQAADGRLRALAIGFAGGRDRERGVLLLAVVAPDARRRGLGRAIVTAVEERLAAAGVTTVEAVFWPGNRIAVRFAEALGYEALPETRATPRYGIPAVPDFDGDGEDRAIFTRTLPRPGD